MILQVGEGGSHCFIAAESGKNDRVVKRISHLIPIGHKYLTLIKTMMIPAFDYEDTIWGERDN